MILSEADLNISRTSDSCLMLDYVRVINFRIIIIIIIISESQKLSNPARGSQSGRQQILNEIVPHFDDTHSVHVHPQH